MSVPEALTTSLQRLCEKPDALYPPLEALAPKVRLRAALRASHDLAVFFTGGCVRLGGPLPCVLYGQTFPHQRKHVSQLNCSCYIVSLKRSMSLIREPKRKRATINPRPRPLNPPWPSTHGLRPNKPDPQPTRGLRLNPLKPFRFWKHQTQNPTPT